MMIAKIRMLIHTSFAFFEHLCALGYALFEFRVHVAETLLYFSSIGLVVAISFVAVDVVVKQHEHFKLEWVKRKGIKK